MFRIQRILMFSWIFALSQAQGVQQSNEPINKKLKVLVLYESLCPDSVGFMAAQLGPAYDKLKDFIDIKLVPFGKSYSENNGEEFYCQHGPDECEGNRKQSCVLSQTENQTKQVKFVVCAMSQRDYFDSCVKSTGLNSDIEKCMTTQNGTQLQLQAEQITKLYSPSFVPTIVYENVFDQELQDSSMHNFHGTVCRLLQKAGIVGFNSPQTPCA